MTNEGKNVCVVVLGDIGRSPRMQYHSLSFAEQQFTVDIIGYGETQPLNDIKSNPQIYLHYLVPYPSMKYCPRLLNYVFKTLWQIITLFFVFLLIRKPHFIIVQNPPAIPSIFVCWLFSFIVRAQLIVDWHNYAYTIMALSLDPKNILVRLTESIEFCFGLKATNLCVTNAMKYDLQTRGISATTLYDRAPDIFQSITLKEKHEVLMRLGNRYQELLSPDNDQNTIFTAVNDHGEIVLKNDRPGLLISSTSWTEDEDFSILLSALQEYENRCTNGNANNLPKLVCIITGKGPLKEYYSKKIRSIVWKYVRIITPWLESGDYPLLLASADLGVCLHTSSSGLDLPMKVVDMFGCGLPVCAYNFKCLDELVLHEVNGYTFNDLRELSSQLFGWFQDFPNNQHQNVIQQKFRLKLKEFQGLRWKENWEKVILPLVRK